LTKNVKSKKFHNSCVVCTCRNVTLGEIVHAIKELGAKDLESIEKLTEAGNSCGSCKSPEHDVGEEKMELYISQILEKFVK